MKLPNAHFARIDKKKITDYLLNSDHPDGKSKSTFFQAGGFNLGAWEILAEALRQHPMMNEVATSEENLYGAKYIVRCHFMTPDGRNPCIITIWIDDSDDRQGPPRLVTAYPAS